MYRELEEETGLRADNVAVLGVTPGWLRYRLPHRAIRRNDKLVCIGQKQVWFLLQFTGTESDLCLAAPDQDRTRVGSGTMVYVRVDLVGRSTMKTKNK